MRKKITIEGMSCGHCAGHVQEALTEMEGVCAAAVDLASKTAIMDSDAEIWDEDIRLAIEDAGYEVLGIEII